MLIFKSLVLKHFYFSVFYISIRFEILHRVIYPCAQVLETISSTVSSSLISGFGSMLFNNTFILPIFITTPTSLAALENGSSCFCALSFSFSSRAMLYASSTLLFGILLDCSISVDGVEGLLKVHQDSN